MTKTQNKKFEINLFDVLGKEEDYEISVGPLHGYIAGILKDHSIKLQGTMLEAGCGTGVFGKQLLKHSPQLKVKGVDIAPSMVARANDGTPRYHALIGDLESSSLFKPKSLDYIFCPFILHHFPSTNRVVKNFSNWLKPGGRLIIVEPNGQNVISRLSKLFRKIVESTLGKEFVVKQQLATPNETNHTMSNYLATLKHYGFKLTYAKTSYVQLKGKNMLSLGGLKTVLEHFLHNLLPKSPLSHSITIILATR